MSSPRRPRRHWTAPAVIAAASLTAIGAALSLWHTDRTAAAEGGAAPTGGSAGNPPATQTRPVVEADLNVITLTAEAEARLGIELATVTMRKTARTRTVPGEVVPRPGGSVILMAPFAGTLRAPKDAKGPEPGQRYKSGQALLTIVPLLTNEARATLGMTLVDADSQVKSADVSREAAAATLARERKLLEDGAGTQKAVELAETARQLADRAHAAAVARRDAIAAVLKGAEAGNDALLPITAPDDSVARAVHATPGQMVATGTPLVELLDDATLWVRASVYVGDAGSLSRAAPATVTPLGKSGGGKPVEAAPAGAPLGAAAGTATVDVHYVIDVAKAGGAWVPGQRVSVAVPLDGDGSEATGVDWSAVVYDVHGGAWVYEQVGDHRFARRRVEVVAVAPDGSATLAAGPPPGTRVVSKGAAELFGREMGFAK